VGRGSDRRAATGSEGRREQTQALKEKPMDDHDPEWQGKGGTLSDKTARKEFGLTQKEIVQAIRTGKLQYREGSMYGNPWLRLLRREVEALVKNERGADYLKERQAKTELTRINSTLKRLKAEIAALEERKLTLLADLEERGR
jgi:hypothetical protein